MIHMISYDNDNIYIYNTLYTANIYIYTYYDVSKATTTEGFYPTTTKQGDFSKPQGFSASCAVRPVAVLRPTAILGIVQLGDGDFAWEKWEKYGENMGETHGKHGKSRWKDDKTWLKLGIWAGNAVVLPCFTSKQMGIWRVHQQEMGWMIAHQAVMRLEEFWSNGHGASHPSVTLGYYESIMVI